MDRNPESDPDEDELPAARSALHEALATRETAVAVASAVVFAALLLLQERKVLSSLTGGEGIPDLTWRLVLPLFMIGISLFVPLRMRFVAMGAMGVFWSAVLVGDAAYFRFFGSVTSMVSAGTAHQLWDVRDSVVELVETSDIFYAAAFSLFFLAAAAPSRWLYGENGPSPRHHHHYSGFTVAAVASVTLLAAWCTPIYEDTHHLGRDKWVMPWEHWGSRFSHATYAATFGLYNYHVRDVVDSLELGSSRAAITDEEAEVLDVVLANKQALNAIPTPFMGVAEGRRIVVIQLEAIVHWLMDLEVAGEPVMPFLTELAGQGLSWDYVMDVTAIGRTSDAEFAVMTGMLPDTTRPNSFAHADRAPHYLPRELKRMGYSTASYHGYNRSFWNRAYTHPTYGIDEMYFDEAYPSDQILGLGVPDSVVYDFLVDRIAEETQPSFSFMISLTSHHPFVYTPKEYHGLFSHLRLEDGYGLLGPYLRSARYADDALRDFFVQMEERGLMEDTLFVIYGDHDMGGLYTDKTLPETGPLIYTVAEDRIPFVILIPGEEERIAEHREAFTDATGALHDVFPTILHLLGEEPPRGLLGTNLFVPDAHREPVPLPQHAGDVLFAHRHSIYTSRGSGPIDPSRAGSMKEAPSSVSMRDGVRDQFIVRDLLDHPEYWDRAEPPGDVVQASVD